MTLFGCLLISSPFFPVQAATPGDSLDPDANLWRSQYRLIDLHQYIGDSQKHLVARIP